MTNEEALRLEAGEILFHNPTTGVGDNHGVTVRQRVLVRVERSCTYEGEVYVKFLTQQPTEIVPQYGTTFVGSSGGAIFVNPRYLERL